MTIIYRLESRTEVSGVHDNVNLGAYRTTLSDGSLLGSIATGYAGAGVNHPTPARDMRLASKWEELEEEYNHCHYVFGFLTLEQLHRWFFKLRELEDHEDEVRIAVYQVSDEFMYPGSFQCIAKASEMKLVDILDKDYNP